MAHGLTLLESIAEGARWYPNREALVQGERDGDRRVTYAAFVDEVRAFAAGLGNAGVEKGDRVAFVTRSTVDHAVAFFGAMWTGAIPATVHYREATPTVVAMVEQLAPTAVVFQPDLREHVDALRESDDVDDAVEAWIALDRLGDPPAYADRASAFATSPSATAPSATAPPLHDPVPSLADRAFVNFSSGTTGIPKPVVHTHANVVESAHLGIFKKQLGPRTRTLKTNTPSFVAWANATFPSLAAGATVVYLERSDPEAILAALEAERVTSVVLVPTVWKRILDADPDAYDLDALTLAGYAGAPMEPRVFDAIRERICERVTTMYGTTETMSSSTVLFPEDVTPDTLDSIGYPVPNTEVRIVDPDARDPDREVSAGDVGELVVRGPSVADEIWDDPVATRETFHPEGWVFTGDLATVGDDHLISLLGRADNMIRSGGINVYPERVRDVLRSHPRIADAAIVGVPHPEWGESPKAFVVPADDALTADALERICRGLDALADYQRPRAFALVDDLPRTGTNKLDYAALKATVADEPGDADEERADDANEE